MVWGGLCKGGYDKLETTEEEAAWVVFYSERKTLPLDKTEEASVVDCFKKVLFDCYVLVEIIWSLSGVF